VITALELKEWLNTLPDDADIFIDDGGLTLQAKTPQGTPSLDVGGYPEI
jgi:hypothetical protein